MYLNKHCRASPRLAVAQMPTAAGGTVRDDVSTRQDTSQNAGGELLLPTSCVDSRVIVFRESQHKRVHALLFYTKSDSTLVGGGRNHKAVGFWGMG